MGKNPLSLLSFRPRQLREVFVGSLRLDRYRFAFGGIAIAASQQGPED
jgi:hypothetical protein